MLAHKPGARGLATSMCAIGVEGLPSPAAAGVLRDEGLGFSAVPEYTRMRELCGAAHGARDLACAVAANAPLKYATRRPGRGGESDDEWGR